MPIPEDQMAIATALLLRREDAVPVEVRDKVKLNHRTEGDSIVLFEFRPGFARPEQWHEEPIAKFKYVQGRNRWQLYWMCGNLKWVRYKGIPEAASFTELFQEVENDRFGCFWG